MRSIRTSIVVAGCLAAPFAAVLGTRGAAFRVAAVPHASPELVINEVMADNATTIADPAGEFDDWLELYNRGPEAIDLGAFRLSDDPGDAAAWALPDVSLAPGARYLVWCDDDVDQGPDHATFKLSLSGEEVLLSTDAGTIDRIAFGIQQTDVSTGRTADGADSWGTCANPSPRGANTCHGALSATLTPEPTLTPTPRPPTPAAPRDALVINELLADNQTVVADPAGEFDDWVELYNRSGAPVSLSGFFLSDDDGDRFAYALPALTLAPGAHHLVWCDGDADQGADHAPFKLSLDGELLVLSSEDAVIDVVTFGPQTTDVSTGRTTDGADTWGICVAPSPRRPNSCSAGSVTPVTPTIPATTPTPTPTPPAPAAFVARMPLALRAVRP